MAKDKGRIYQHMEKVIVTAKDVARIGYVVASKTDGSTGLYADGAARVRVCYNLEDAQEHRYSIINGIHVMPYKQELWDAFERLVQREMECRAMFIQLVNGRIPKELAAVVQGDLFKIENTRPLGRE